MVKVRSGAQKDTTYVARRGFRADRAERFLQAKMGNKKKVERKIAVKEIKFDPSSRADFVLGFHRRKNERKAKAQFQTRVTQQKKVKSDRQDLREAARQQYNATMQVPIQPDFTLKLPDLRPRDVESQSFGGVVVTTAPLNMEDNDETKLTPLAVKALEKLKEKKRKMALKPQFDMNKELQRLRRINTHSRKSKRKKAKPRKKSSNQHRH
eukprot:PhF_6_TR38713/c1_g1_i1/m.57939